MTVKDGAPDARKYAAFRNLAGIVDDSADLNVCAALLQLIFNLFQKLFQCHIPIPFYFQPQYIVLLSLYH